MKQAQLLLRRSFLSLKPLFFCSSTNQPPQTPQQPQIHSVVDNFSASYCVSDTIPGTYQGGNGVYVIMFKCGPCGNKMARTFTKDAYHKGVVLIRCDQCDNIHLIADNLGWFQDEKWNVEIHAQEQGQQLNKIIDPQVSKLVNEFIQKQKNS
ncbi:unnamed protein product [Paramecium sonneborni]|uniref:DNL-type domain-containing protein n=1 Tax=Paramecium sonneborni TaxID=65129 RepID=A0A8S1KZF6_9CILI|nr:unnamed protein product [Paramecium sonneborni]